MMEFKHTIDSFKEGTRDVADVASTKTKEVHEKYISKLVPQCGKYGDAARFAAELIPGVAEYNAICEGDWKAFAVAAGIDLATIAVPAGLGYAAAKGGSKLANESVEAATKEIAEVGTEKVFKEAAEAYTEIAMREVNEANQIFLNKLDGIAREEKVLTELISKYGEENVIREALIRDANGLPIKDVITNEARRIDFVVIDGKKVLNSIEVTSETASKVAQTQKELRILEQAKESGGAFIKTSAGELIQFGEDIVTEIVRL